MGLGDATVSVVTAPMTTAQIDTYHIAADGQPAPMYQVLSGTLPPGLTLAPDGTLSGTPSAAGAYTFQVAAFNSSGLLTSSQITVTIT